MATSTIKALTSELVNVSSIVKVQKYGKVRIVNINGDITTSTIVSGLDAPLSTTWAIGRYKNTSNTYYPALCTLSETGSISASYFNDTAAAGISNGTLTATLVYITG